MSDRERFTIILAGIVLSLGVTGVIAWLAIVATDAGERNLLIGGLIGTGAFGGGALFSLLGITHKPAPAAEVQSASTVNVNPDAPTTTPLERRP